MTWLAWTAKELNLLSELFQAENTKGKGRLKGKARAAQKGTGVEKHLLSLADVTRIVESITKKKIMVPGGIIGTLEAVIAARSEFNEFFEYVPLLLPSSDIALTYL